MLIAVELAEILEVQILECPHSPTREWTRPLLLVHFFFFSFIYLFASVQIYTEKAKDKGSLMVSVFIVDMGLRQ